MNQIEQILALMGIGALATLGKLLVSRKTLSARSLIGSAIVGGTLGVIAGLVFLWFPTVPLIAQIAAASAISTAGHDILRATIGAFVFKWTGKDIDIDAHHEVTTKKED